MSIDVQMFVLCDHLVSGTEINDPMEKPKLTVEFNAQSTLEPGTYYVVNTFINRHADETCRGPFSKIYVEEKRSLNIELAQYFNEDLISTKNVYVGYTKENLTNTHLTDIQIKREQEVLSNLSFQDNVIRGIYKMTELKRVVKYPPSKNTTKTANYNGRESTCPKCLGKGYYYDIYFDKAGKAITATKSQKLLQECLKVLVDEKLGNKFHPNWGCDIEQRIGTKNMGSSIEMLKVELSVRDAVERLRKLQMNNQIMYGNMNEEEIIDTIESIDVTKDGPTGYNIDIEVVSVMGEVITYNIRL
ncbi:gp187 [Bacillus phage G]|uniref:Gp187 n=1 Tax=Bacillus phage G TaxID=2884420 RepID=G3MBQ3_9CAUD|nr:gp187 [Bacillus phage G]AEO93447.1 gp187 [Bacillus phage G]